MSRNMNRITAWYSKQAAWADWQDAAGRAAIAGYSIQVKQLLPSTTAGHANIDKATIRLCSLANISLPDELTYTYMSKEFYQ